MNEKHIRNKILYLLTVLLIAISLFGFIRIKSYYNQTIDAEIQVEKLLQEKQLLIERIEYLDQIVQKQSLNYSLLFDGIEDDLRKDLSSVKATGLSSNIMSHEAEEIMTILDSHVNDPVNFTVKGDNYQYLIYKDLIAGELRCHIKYLLENSNRIDVYLEYEILPSKLTEENRLIYHWIKILKIPCKSNNNCAVFFHILPPAANRLPR